MAVNLNQNELVTIPNPQATSAAPLPRDVSMYRKGEIDKLVGVATGPDPNTGATTPQAIPVPIAPHMLDDGPAGVHFASGEKATVLNDIASNTTAITNINNTIINIEQGLEEGADDIDALQDGLAAEIQRATNAENGIAASLTAHSGGLVGGSAIHVTALDKANWNAKVSQTELSDETQRAMAAELLNATNIANHVSNTAVHVTQDNKNTWNNKVDQTALQAEVTRATTAEQALNQSIIDETNERTTADQQLYTDKLDKLAGPLAYGKIVCTAVNAPGGNGQMVESDTALSDLIPRTEAAAKYIPKIPRLVPAPGGMLVKTTADGILEETTFPFSDVASATALSAEVTRATTAENVLAQEIATLHNLGRWLGSVATVAALSTFTLPAGASPNDFVTVQADENHGGATAQYILTAVGPPAVWAFNHIINDDTSGKMNTVASPTGGKILADDALGQAIETSLTAAQITNVINIVTDPTTGLDAALAAEIARAIAAETANATAISNEVTRATTNEATIANNLSQEVTGRTNADTQLQNNIDNLALQVKGRNLGSYTSTPPADTSGVLVSDITPKPGDFCIVNSAAGSDDWGSSIYVINSVTGTAITWGFRSTLSGTVRGMGPRQSADGTNTSRLPVVSGTPARLSFAFPWSPEGAQASAAYKDGLTDMMYTTGSGWTRAASFSQKQGGTLVKVLPAGSTVSQLPTIGGTLPNMVCDKDFAIIINDGIYQEQWRDPGVGNPTNWVKVVDLSTSDNTPGVGGRNLGLYAASTALNSAYTSAGVQTKTLYGSVLPAGCKPTAGDWVEIKHDNIKGSVNSSVQYGRLRWFFVTGTPDGSGNYQVTNAAPDGSGILSFIESSRRQIGGRNFQVPAVASLPTDTNGQGDVTTPMISDVAYIAAQNASIAGATKYIASSNASGIYWEPRVEPIANGGSGATTAAAAMTAFSGGAGAPNLITELKKISGW